MTSLRKACLLVLASIGFSVPTHGQLKHEALVVPVYFVGIKDTSSQRILEQHVLTELSQSFELRTEKEIEAAREKAFDKLASKDCNELACLKLMGELLDVDYTFVVLVSASGDYWDLTGVRLDPLGGTVRKSVECQDCTLPKARAGLSKLLRGLRPGGVSMEKGDALLIIESEPRGQVFVQGRPQGETPIEVTVPTYKSVDILIVAEGYTDFAKVYDSIRPGQRIRERVRLVPKRGKVEFTSKPSEAKIQLDGKLLQDESGNPMITTVWLRLEYGDHTIVASKEGYRDAQRSFTVEKSDLGKIKLVLEPLPGRLVVRVPSKYHNARVLVDGKEIGEMSGDIAKTFEVEAETRLRVQARQDNLNSETVTVFLSANGSKTVSFEDFSESTSAGSSELESNKLWALYSSFSSTKTSVAINTLHFTRHGLGIGLSNHRFSGETSKGNTFEGYGLTCDLSYTWGQDWFATLGTGFPIIGNGSIFISSGKYQSRRTGGNSLFGLVGTRLSWVDGIFGYEAFEIKFSDFLHDSNNTALSGTALTVTGGVAIIGIGVIF